MKHVVLKRSINGQYQQGDMINKFTHKENANQLTLRFHLTPIRKVIIKKQHVVVVAHTYNPSYVEIDIRYIMVQGQIRPNKKVIRFISTKQANSDGLCLPAT
jgi:hypothetical protein